MLDPLERWKALGLPDKPDYAGLLTFAGLPYTQDPAELDGVDVAIVGAPTDDLVSDRPGTRFGPRAIRAAGCPPGPHLEARVDWAERLRVVDFGDAPVIPADARRTPRSRRSSREVVDAGALPVVLEGPLDLEPTSGRSPTDRPFGSSTSTRTPTREPRCSASRSRTGRRCSASSVTVTWTAGATCRSGSEATGRASANSPGSASVASRASSCTTSASSASARSSSGRSPPWARDLRSSRSTWTCSTRPSRPEPGRPSRVG